MTKPRTSIATIELLLLSMNATVTSYHPTVRRTGSSLGDLVAGTACFPGGTGLWRGVTNGGSLPEHFPERPVMFVAHNFDSQRAFEVTFRNKGEASGTFWQRLLVMLAAANLEPSECFFTNALMGLKPGSATGPMPSVRGYQEQCGSFLQAQVDIVEPRAVVALGVKAQPFVRRLNVPNTMVKHPNHWDFRPLVTQRERLREEGFQLASFLESN